MEKTLEVSTEKAPPEQNDFVSDDDPRAALLGWWGDLPMGGWATDDEDAFHAEILAEIKEVDSLENLGLEEEEEEDYESLIRIERVLPTVAFFTAHGVQHRVLIAKAFRTYRYHLQELAHDSQRCRNIGVAVSIPSDWLREVDAEEVAMADVLAETDPHFDRDRFYAACEGGNALDPNPWVDLCEACYESTAEWLYKQQVVPNGTPSAASGDSGGILTFF